MLVVSLTLSWPPLSVFVARRCKKIVGFDSDRPRTTACHESCATYCGNFYTLHSQGSCLVALRFVQCDSEWAFWSRSRRKLDQSWNNVHSKSLIILNTYRWYDHGFTSREFPGRHWFHWPRNRDTQCCPLKSSKSKSGGTDLLFPTPASASNIYPSISRTLEDVIAEKHVVTAYHWQNDLHLCFPTTDH